MSELNIGDKVKDFELLDQEGNSVKLSAFKGSKILVYFYPKASTPGCTTQSCAVSEAKEDFAGLGCKVIGISPDQPGKQKKFDDKYNLGFTLLCDTEQKVANIFGVWGEKKMYGKSYMGIIRSSFLLDEEGKIIKCWYKVSPKDTVPFAKEALEG